MHGLSSCWARKVKSDSQHSLQRNGYRVLPGNFLARLYACGDWQRLLRNGLNRQALFDFHARYKYLLMALNRPQYQALGRLLADNRESMEVFAPRYFQQLLAALRQEATRGSHANVLQHIAGYLKRVLNREEKRTLQDAIDRYRLGRVPLSLPVALLKRHFQTHPHAYISRQVYLKLPSSAPRPGYPRRH